MLHFTERTCKCKNVSNLPKTSFFHQTKALSDPTSMCYRCRRSGGGERPGTSSGFTHTFSNQNVISPRIFQQELSVEAGMITMNIKLANRLSCSLKKQNPPLPNSVSAATPQHHSTDMTLEVFFFFSFSFFSKIVNSTNKYQGLCFRSYFSQRT